MRGETKETVLLAGGFQVDLRVVRPEEFGAALQYFTGSKDHNVRLRSLARDRGLKVNEYGVFRGDDRIAGATEEEVYASLGLAWIPPELREDRGEIEAAARGTVPALVTDSDLRGDLHVHLAPDARPEDVDRIAAAARKRAYSYVGVVVGGVRSDGTVWLLPEATRVRLSEFRSPGLRISRALETGPGVVPDDFEATAFDFRIVMPVALPPEVPGPRAGSRPVALYAHIGSSVASDAAVLKRWVEEAQRNAAAIEVGPGPERLDSTAGRQAREAGVLLHLPTALGGAEDDPTRLVALGFARRAGAAPKEVTNARSPEEFSGAGSGSKRTPRGTSSALPRSPSAKKRAA
jgi:DNA polymerase (family X)